MGDLFNPDGKFYRFMERVIELIKLNFLWVLFSLPVVTIGASTCAMFAVAGQIADGEEGYIWKPFWSAFRANWKKASVLWLIVGVAGAGLIMDYRFWTLVDSPVSGMMKGLTIGLTFLFLTGAVYVFPLAARMDTDVKTILRTSWLLGIKYLPRTFLMLVWIVLESFAVRLWALALLLGMLVGVSGMAWIVEMYLTRVLELEQDSKGTEAPVPLHTLRALKKGPRL